MSNRRKIRITEAIPVAMPPSAGPAVLGAGELPATIPASVRIAVLERGEEWPPGGCGNLPRQPARLCLLSCARLALKHRGLTYCEGAALTLGTWQHHAWLADQHGEVVEAVWRWPADRYCGIAFPDTDVRHALQRAHPHFTGLLTTAASAEPGGAGHNALKKHP